MSSPVPLLNRISLLGKPQRVGPVKEMTDTCEVRDRNIESGLRFADNRGQSLLPVRLYRPVIYTPPRGRHVRQTISKQNRRNSCHIPVRTGNISRPVGLVASLSDKIEAAFASGRLDPPIRCSTGQHYGRLSPDWARRDLLDNLADYLAALSHLIHVDHRPTEGITVRSG